jgi:MoaE-MoaD fusion protein
VERPRVTVLAFGPLRERIGAAELDAEGVTVREIWDQVVRAHPDAAALRESIRAARNHSYCEWDDAVATGDTIAFLPPVAGGSDRARRVHVALTEAAIDVPSVLASVAGDGDGAIASFIGRVRSMSDGHAVSGIDYEVYGAMAEAELRGIGDAMCDRGISAISIVHRVGSLRVGDASVIIAVAAPHREAALRACADAIDMLKQSVPIWKREHRDDGAHWVDQRSHAPMSDDRRTKERR